jgi:16S rRNA (guanine(966)-N(2))-methyltransferase RsmD
LIEAPDGNKTRPTQSRLRQALFNSIQAHVSQAVVLDLFSGSGALGFEALSRGASRIVFVENSRAAQRLIEQNAKDLGVSGQIEILSEGLPRAWKRVAERAPFHLVLADPPYAEGWELDLLIKQAWETLLLPEGLFVIEWGVQKSKFEALPDQAGRLVKVREKNYGDSALSTYQLVRNI